MFSKTLSYHLSCSDTSLAESHYSWPFKKNPDQSYSTADKIFDFHTADVFYSLALYMVTQV